MAPVVAESKRAGLPVTVWHTQQHRDLWHGTGLTPDALLDCGLEGRDPLTDGQRVEDTVLRALSPAITGLIVQGDTLSAFGGAGAAYVQHLPLVHVEAGVRSGNLDHPWPEEFFRQAIDTSATLRLCATEANRQHLLREKLDGVVTGNSGVDACLLRQRPVHLTDRLEHVLITLHRRESFGAPMQAIVEGLLRVVVSCPEITFQWPLHPNPALQDALPTVVPPNLRLGPPLAYSTFLTKLAHAQAVLTDSGGVQEDAATLGIPAVIAREVTDRPESVATGQAVVAGRTADGVERGLWRAIGGHLVTEPSDVFGERGAAAKIVAAVQGI
jgi:UDP-N-acetylglucosamine 2-epimerase (non-hydrolysing)